MNFESILILFFASIIFVSARKKIDEASEACFSETGSSQKDMDEVIRKKPIATDNENLKCYFKCLLQAITWMGEDGEIYDKPKDSSFGIADVEIQNSAHCVNVTGTNPCDKGFNFFKCTVERDMEEKEAEESRLHPHNN